MPAPIHGYLGIMRQNGMLGSLFPVRTGECTIGRGIHCDVRMHLDSVSDRQCIISSRFNKESTIRNLSETSDTYVNDRVLGSKTAVLSQGDLITMSDRCFRWEYPSTSQFWKNVATPNKGFKTVIERPVRAGASKNASLGKLGEQKGATDEVVETRALPPPQDLLSTSRHLPAFSFKTTTNSPDKSPTTNKKRETQKSSPRNVPNSPKKKPLVGTKTHPHKMQQSKVSVISPSVKKGNPTWSTKLKPASLKNAASPAEKIIKKSNNSQLTDVHKKMQPERLSETKKTRPGKQATDPHNKPVGVKHLQTTVSSTKKNNTTKHSSIAVHGYLTVERQTGFSKCRIPVYKAVCTIGRGMDSTMRIALASISDKHCVITSPKNNASKIRNLSTSATTLLNGVDVGNKAIPLHQGDVISLGERNFLWEYPTDSPFATVPSGAESLVTKCSDSDETEVDSTFAEECSKYLKRQAEVDIAEGKSPTYITPEFSAAFKTSATYKGSKMPISSPAFFKTASPLTKFMLNNSGSEQNVSTDLTSSLLAKASTKKPLRSSSSISSVGTSKIKRFPGKPTPLKRSRLTLTHSKLSPSRSPKNFGDKSWKSTPVRPSSVSLVNTSSGGSATTTSSGTPSPKTSLGKTSAIIANSMFKGFCITSN